MPLNSGAGYQLSSNSNAYVCAGTPIPDLTDTLEAI